MNRRRFFSNLVASVGTLVAVYAAPFNPLRKLVPERIDKEYSFVSASMVDLIKGNSVNWHHVPFSIPFPTKENAHTVKIKILPTP